MKKLLTLPHFHTGAEVAGLLQVDPEIIDRLIRCEIHPPRIWKPRWKEPRWGASTIPDWLEIINTIDVNSLPENPPPLQRPSEVFKQSRRGPTKGELAIAAKACGVRVCNGG